MGLKNKKLKIGVLLIATLIVTCGAYVIGANVAPKNNGIFPGIQEFSLVRPVFAQGMDPGTTFLDQEAGIAIWLNATADSPLNLTTVQTKMAGNLEQNTSDYIIGSIAVPGIDTDYYPHCFVSKSGWIVVYYSNTDPTSKAISLHTYDYFNINWTTDAGSLETNFLLNALNYTCQNVTQKTSIDNAEYYNFEYPSATAIMIAAKTGGNGETDKFNFLIPSSFTIDEASWSFYSPQGGNWYMDGEASIHNTGIAHGSISSLITGQYHNVTVSGDTNYVYHNWATVGIIVLYHAAQSVAPGIVVNDADYNSYAALPVESLRPLAITNVSQNPPNGSVLPTNEVSVNVTITDTISTVTQVFLNYSSGNGTWIMAVNMTNLVGNIWNSTIPQFPYGTNVTYVVEAGDNLGDAITTEQLGYTLQYTVTPEFPTLLVVFPFLTVTFLAVLFCKKKTKFLQADPLAS